MKKRGFLFGLLLVFAVEIAALIAFAAGDVGTSQDTVAVNEVMQSVRRDWKRMEDHENKTDLAYAVLDAEGRVLFRTEPGVSESVNAAVAHRDTILDLEAEGLVQGKVIIYNEEGWRLQEQKQRTVVVLAAAVLVQWIICIGYAFYLNRTVIRPFEKLKGFARRVAGGNLDIPLEMDRQNLFGAFTESFDIMRSELRKARIAEAEANASKKELVAKLSHDIKTPVASIKAASEVGAALAKEERTRENYTQIIRKADQINTLVTNLFTATLEELQQLLVAPADMESRELEEMLESSDYLHRASVSAIPECLLYADHLRLQQVFDNIFANSYKYGNTDIAVAAYREKDRLAISIEDFGGGVPEEELPLLKEKFKRGSNAEAIEGAGLGLYISDYFMKKMKGDLVVENGENGLRVTVFISLSGTI
ncbi:MAG: HAMP domain-containing sensor histidine kinase [Lachnospiraceae bacterium]|nr:HAMP domain-containing sensor histidine kinase [Lachnospiraceae bacterium]